MRSSTSTLPSAPTVCQAPFSPRPALLLLPLLLTLLTTPLFAQVSFGPPVSDSLIHPPFAAYPAVDTSISLKHLRWQIQSVLNSPSVRSADPSLKLVFFGPQGKEQHVYSVRADEPVIPASQEKLFTSLASIWTFGDDYQFRTRIVCNQEDIHKGVLYANIYVRPSGDPTLTSDDLDSLAEICAKKGLKRIHGDVVSDLRLDDELSPEAREALLSDEQRNTIHIASFPPKAPDREYLTAKNAFTLDRNVAELAVHASHAGSRPTIDGALGIAVVNHATVSGAHYVTRKVRVHGKILRKRVRVNGSNSFHYRISQTESGPVLTLTGYLPVGSTRSITVPVGDPAQRMALAFKQALERHHVAVDGVARSGHCLLIRQHLITQTEHSLWSVLAHMNKPSDNYLGDALFHKFTTVRALREAAPSERPTRVMSEALMQCDSDGHCTLTDGSGLSRENRITANSVMDLLLGVHQSEYYAKFLNTLSVAGVDGTLRNRLKDSPADGILRGKTGTLHDVSAVSGFTLTGDGQLAAFFITFQHCTGNIHKYKVAENKILDAISSFSYYDTGS